MIYINNHKLIMRISENFKRSNSSFLRQKTTENFVTIPIVPDEPDGPALEKVEKTNILIFQFISPTLADGLCEDPMSLNRF